MEETPTKYRRRPRRSLCVPIKNPRVRRMLDLDEFKNDCTTTHYGNDDWLRKNTSKKEKDKKKEKEKITLPSSLNKNETLSSKGRTEKQKRDDNWTLTTLMSPSQRNKQEVFAYKGCTTLEDNDLQLKKTSNETNLHGVHIEGITQIETREDNVKKDITTDFKSNSNIDENDEELEEPFSPVVSEYIPGSDSNDSEENIHSEKRRKRKKLNNQDTRNVQSSKLSLLQAEVEPDVKLTSSLVGDLDVAYNMKEGTPKSQHTETLANTPCLSLVHYKKISTPDSFKEILKAVQNKSTNNELIDSHYNAAAQPIDQQLVCTTTKRNKNCLRAIDISYEKFYFIASTSKVYINCDVNKEHTEEDSNPLVSTEMDTTNNEHCDVNKEHTEEDSNPLISTGMDTIDNVNCEINKEHTGEDSNPLVSTGMDTIDNENCDINIEHTEEDSNPLISTEMDTTDNENVEVSIPFYQDPPLSPDFTEAQSTKIDFVATQSMVYINDENFNANIEPTSTKRLSRKRVRDESSWQVNKNKLLKNSGKRYHSKASKKERSGKIMGEPCTCKKKCNEKIDNSERMIAFESYWKLASHERQWDYILKYVKGKPTRIALLNAKRPRTQTLIYSLPKRNGRDLVTVCKKMFLQTLNINDRTVYTALEKQENHTIVDMRGHHTNRPSKVNENTTKSVVDHVNMFPRKESHYLRKQTQREYLDEKLNCAKMHRLYLDWIKNNPEYANVTPASERWYYYIFNTKFNIGFFHPKKDLCETCSLYDQADSEKKEQLKEEYDNHIKNKERVREIKNQEKENSDAKEKTVACFDLEKVLSLPQSEVGVFHYKRKYPVYNFTIYNILTKTGHCYVWHAQIAKRGANEIASCLWSYLKAEAEKGIKEISFYSDNCTGQNRNRFVFALYIHASKELNIKITHRFLQKGHTQNEGDSMHSCIEKSKKNHVLYVPEEMYAVIRNAKVQGQKYNVKEMTQEDFLNFKNLVTENKNWEKDDSGKKVNWTKIKEISVDPLSLGKLFVKYEFFEQVVTVDTTRNGRARRKKNTESETSERSTQLEKLYDGPLPISANLLKDLLSLCNSNNIPQHYHSFYNNLHAQSIASDSEHED